VLRRGEVTDVLAWNRDEGTRESDPKERRKGAREEQRRMAGALGSPATGRISAGGHGVRKAIFRHLIFMLEVKDIGENVLGKQSMSFGDGCWSCFV
jgi:hypothetical protein